MAGFVKYYGVPPADYREIENRTRLTLTAGQTTCQAPYSIGFVDVYYNGAWLDPFTEFTATDGANIVLATGALATGDVLAVISRAQVQLTNTYTQAQVNALANNYYGICTGTANAQVLVTVPSFTSFSDGMVIRCRAVGSNSSSTPTIAINGLPAKTIIMNNGDGSLAGSDFTTNSELTLQYVQTLDKFVLVTGGLTGGLPNQFNNSSALATTSFVQRALGNTQGLISVTNSITLTTAQVGSFVEISSGASAGITITLPTAVGIAGSSFQFSNISANGVTLAGNSSQLIYINASGSNTVALASGESMVITSDGAGWTLISGTGASTFSNPGYTKLPNGLIMQWGSSTFTGTITSITTTFPVTFPNAYLRGIISDAGSGAFGGGISANSTSSFTIYCPPYLTNTGTVTAKSGSITLQWIALGY